MNKKIFKSIFIKIELQNENLFCGNIIVDLVDLLLMTVV